MRFSTQTTLCIGLALMAFGIVMRLLPHPANMTPLTAIALVSGMYFRGKWTVLVPVLTMVVSDLFIGWHNIVLFTWGSFAAAVFIGVLLRKKHVSMRIIGGALAGSTLFFLVTNWAVWAFGAMYPKTASGLFESYVMGLPFFRNMAVGDLLFTAVFVCAFEAVRVLQRSRASVAST